MSMGRVGGCVRLRVLCPRPIKRRKVKKEHAVQSSLFLKLPRKLRDMVYSYLWTCTPLITEPYFTDADGYSIYGGYRKLLASSVGPALSIVYNDMDEDKQCCLSYEFLPQWLLVSKSFMCGSTEQFR
jgi:hypothetical protein